MKGALRAFSEGQAASARVREALWASAAWRAATVIYGYRPLRSEPDWLGTGTGEKTIAYPKLTPAGLRFVTARTFESGPSGVEEPVDGVPAPPPDLILVPGLAFDPAGRRLGRGGGFYDRFLAAQSNFWGVVCGVCFSFQIVSRVPNEPHDMRVACLLSEKGWERIPDGK